MDIKHASGCLFGMAFGDALGAPTEFLNIEEILHQFPPNGPQELLGSPILVTDDTQMALAVGEALAASPRPFTPDKLKEEIQTRFINWYNSPDNDRAPGNTCLSACENLIDGMVWQEACDISSKGCGANMRVMPVGVLDLTASTRAKIAQFQAAFTHGHPTGLAAADLTAFVIADLGNGGTPQDLARRVRAYAESQREVYHEDWLGDLWMRSVVMRTPQDYIAHGWNECLGILDRLDDALNLMDRQTDPCLAIGKGWIAEEAFGTALLCFLYFPDDPVSVIQRAAVTSGDSDTIACIAGSFAGAYHGIDAWPHDWKQRIEYHSRIQSIANALTS